MYDVTPYPQRFMSLMKNFVCGECGALENPGPVFFGLWKWNLLFHVVSSIIHYWW